MDLDWEGEPLQLATTTTNNTTFEVENPCSVKSRFVMRPKKTYDADGWEAIRGHQEKKHTPVTTGPRRTNKNPPITSQNIFDILDEEDA